MEEKEKNLAEETKQESVKQEEFASKYPAVNIFVYSDLYENIEAAVEWCCNNIPHFTEYTSQTSAIHKPIVVELVEIGKKLQIVKEDITAIFTEIGATVDEETAHKIRAIMGRWVGNASYDDLVGFLLGYLKLASTENMAFYADDVTKKLGLMSDEETENLIVPCSICLMWCMLIETGVAAEKGMKDNTTYMPSTLKTVIAIDKISRSKYHDKTNTSTIFGVFMDVVLNNIARYEGKRPHESEITYAIVIKNALKRIGTDPANYVYRALDGKEDWSMFAFLTENI